MRISGAVMMRKRHKNRDSEPDAQEFLEPAWIAYIGCFAHRFQCHFTFEEERRMKTEPAPEVRDNALVPEESVNREAVNSPTAGLEPPKLVKPEVEVAEETVELYATEVIAS